VLLLPEGRASGVSPAICTANKWCRLVIITTLYISFVRCPNSTWLLRYDAAFQAGVFAAVVTIVGFIMAVAWVSLVVGHTIASATLPYEQGR
jgi:hypothetical protein